MARFAQAAAGACLDRRLADWDGHHRRLLRAVDHGPVRDGEFPYSKYNSWNAIDDYNLTSTLKIKNHLSSLMPKDLWRSVSRINIDGIRRTTIVRDVLIHVLAEELHHRGEIIAILWQMNIQPPDMGWLSVMKKTDPVWVLM